MQDDIKTRVFRAISQVMAVPIEHVSLESSPDNIADWDSLKHMNLVFALEEDFDLKFTDDQIIAELLSAGMIVGVIEKIVGDC